MSMSPYKDLDAAGVAALTALFAQTEGATCHSTEVIKRFLCSLQYCGGLVSLNDIIRRLDEVNKSHVMQVLSFAFTQPGFFADHVNQFDSQLVRFRKELKIRKSA